VQIAAVGVQTVAVAEIVVVPEILVQALAEQLIYFCSPEEIAADSEFVL